MFVSFILSHHCLLPLDIRNLQCSNGIVPSIFFCVNSNPQLSIHSTRTHWPIGVA